MHLDHISSVYDILASFFFPFLLFPFHFLPPNAKDGCSYSFDCSRLRAASKTQGDAARKVRTRERHARAMPAPDANAELQTNIDVCLLICLCELVFYVHVWISSYKHKYAI